MKGNRGWNRLMAALLSVVLLASLVGEPAFAVTEATTVSSEAALSESSQEEAAADVSAAAEEEEESAEPTQVDNDDASEPAPIDSDSDQADTTDPIPADDSEPEEETQPEPVEDEPEPVAEPQDEPVTVEPVLTLTKTTQEGTEAVTYTAALDPESISFTTEWTEGEPEPEHYIDLNEADYLWTWQLDEEEPVTLEAEENTHWVCVYPRPLEEGEQLTCTMTFQYDGETYTVTATDVAPAILSTLYVQQSTTEEVEEQDGSLEHPFQTIDQAYSALASGKHTKNASAEDNVIAIIGDYQVSQPGRYRYGRYKYSSTSDESDSVVFSELLQGHKPMYVSNSVTDFNIGTNPDLNNGTVAAAMEDMVGGSHVNVTIRSARQDEAQGKSTIYVLATNADNENCVLQYGDLNFEDIELHFCQYQTGNGTAVALPEKKINGRIAWYCNGYDLTMGEGVEISGISKLDGAINNGVPVAFTKANAVQNLTIVAGSFTSLPIAAAMVQASDGRYYLDPTKLSNTIIIRSGTYARIMGGGRSGDTFTQEMEVLRSDDGSGQVTADRPYVRNGLYGTTLDEVRTYSYDDLWISNLYLLGDENTIVGLVAGGQTDSIYYGSSNVIIGGSTTVGVALAGSIGYGINMIKTWNKENGVDRETGQFTVSWASMKEYAFDFKGDSNVTLQDNAKVWNLYGGSLGRNGNGTVNTDNLPYCAMRGERVTITITGGTVVKSSAEGSGNVYGGGAGGTTGTFSNEKQPASQGVGTVIAPCNVTIHMSGGTVEGNLLGGGDGYYEWAQNSLNRHAGWVVGDITVNLSGGTVKGNVYGGGEGINQQQGARSGLYNLSANENVRSFAQTFGSVTVNLSGGTVEGSVFGGGQGYTSTDKTALTYGIYPNMAMVTGRTAVYLSQQVRVKGSVYGGGESGSVVANLGGTETTAEGWNQNAYSGTMVVLLGGSVGTAYDGVGNEIDPLTTNMIGKQASSIAAGTGYVFGGCKSADVVGYAKVILLGGTVWSEVYGGNNESGTVGISQGDAAKYNSGRSEIVIPTTYEGMGGTFVYVGARTSGGAVYRPDLRQALFGGGLGYETSANSSLVRVGDMVNETLLTQEQIRQVTESTDYQRYLEDGNNSEDYARVVLSAITSQLAASSNTAAQAKLLAALDGTKNNDQIRIANRIYGGGQEGLVDTAAVVLYGGTMYLNNEGKAKDSPTWVNFAAVFGGGLGMSLTGSIRDDYPANVQKSRVIIGGNFDSYYLSEQNSTSHDWAVENEAGEWEQLPFKVFGGGQLATAGLSNSDIRAGSSNPSAIDPAAGTNPDGNPLYSSNAAGTVTTNNPSSTLGIYDDVTTTYVRIKDNAYVAGNVYGAGRGRSTMPHAYAVVYGNSEVVLDGDAWVLREDSVLNTASSSVMIFGGAQSADVRQGTLANGAVYGGNTIVRMRGNSRADRIFGGNETDGTIQGNTYVYIGNADLEGNAVDYGTTAASVNPETGASETLQPQPVVYQVYGAGYQAPFDHSSYVTIEGKTTHTQAWELAIRDRVNQLNQEKSTDTMGQFLENLSSGLRTALVGGAYGGGLQAEAGETYVNVIGGVVGNLYGGGLQSGARNTHVTVGTNGTVLLNVYGGCNQKGTITGTAYVLIGAESDRDAASVGRIHLFGNVFGGGYGVNTITQNTSVVVNLPLSIRTVSLGTDDTTTSDDFYTGKVSTCDITITESPDSTKVMNYTSGRVNPSYRWTHPNSEDETERDDVNGSFVDGSVYGGGDMGQVGTGKVTGGGTSANITKAGTTQVTIVNGHITGSVFGGGNGEPAAGLIRSTTMGVVFGTSYVTMHSGVVEGSVYGGGNQSYHFAPTTTDQSGKTKKQATVVTLDEIKNAGQQSKAVVIFGSVFSGGNTVPGSTFATVYTIYGDTTMNINGRSDRPDSATLIYLFGGVYGDGNLCLVQGDRTINISDVHYNTENRTLLKTFYSIQRADVVNLKNTRVVLVGAPDLVEMSGANTDFSINRVGQLNMMENSTIKLNTIVNLLGGLSSDEQTSTKFINKGNNGQSSRDYTKRGGTANSQDIRVNHDSEEGRSRENLYHLQYEAYQDGTLGTSSASAQVQAAAAEWEISSFNVVCVANGRYLEIKKSSSTYGDVTGLFCLELLYAVPGQGGGFVYGSLGDDTDQGSTGDFICCTLYDDGKSATFENYMYVDDDPGGYSAASEDYTYYYWYIYSRNIQYTVELEGYVSSAVTDFPTEVAMTTVEPGYTYVLGQVYVDAAINEAAAKANSMTSADNVTNLFHSKHFKNHWDESMASSEDYAIELKLTVSYVDSGGVSHSTQVPFGYLSYNAAHRDEENNLQPWGIYVPETGETLYGMGSDATSGNEGGTAARLTANILGSIPENLGTIKGVQMSFVLHKGSGVRVELERVPVSLVIYGYAPDKGNKNGLGLSDSDRDIFTFHTFTSITTMVPTQSIMLDYGRQFSAFFPQGNVSITENSSFSAEVVTQYVPAVYPITQRRFTLSDDGRIYLSDLENGIAFTLDREGKLIYASRGSVGGIQTASTQGWNVIPADVQETAEHYGLARVEKRYADGSYTVYAGYDAQGQVVSYVLDYGSGSPEPGAIKVLNPVTLTDQDGDTITQFPYGTVITLTAVINEDTEHTTYWYYYCTEETYGEGGWGESGVPLEQFYRMNTETGEKEYFSLEAASGDSKIASSTQTIMEDLIFAVDFSNAYQYDGEERNQVNDNWVTTVQNECKVRVAYEFESAGGYSQGEIMEYVTTQKNDQDQLTYVRHYPTYSSHSVIISRDADGLAHGTTGGTTDYQNRQGVTLALSQQAYTSNELISGTVTVAEDKEFINTQYDPDYDRREYAVMLTLQQEQNDGSWQTISFPVGATASCDGSAIGIGRSGSDSGEHLILPVEKAGTYSYTLDLTNSCGLEPGNYQLVATLYSAQIADYYNELLTGHTFAKAFTVNAEEDYALRIQGENHIYRLGDPIALTVETNDTQGEVQVKLFRYRSNTENIYREMSLTDLFTESVSGTLTLDSPAENGVRSATWKGTLSLPSAAKGTSSRNGTYRLEFTYHNRVEYYDFIIVSD